MSCIDRIETGGRQIPKGRPAEYLHQKLFRDYLATLPDGINPVTAFIDDAKKYGVISADVDPELEQLVDSINNRSDLTKIECGDLEFDPASRYIFWRNGKNPEQMTNTEAKVMTLLAYRFRHIVPRYYLARVASEGASQLGTINELYVMVISLRRLRLHDQVTKYPNKRTNYLRLRTAFGKGYGLYLPDDPWAGI